MLVILPDGKRVDLASVVYAYDGAHTITFTNIGGGTFTYIDANSNAVNTKYVLTQLDQFRVYGFQGNGVPQLLAAKFVITSISPSAFDIVTATITINGSGFDPNTLGLLWATQTAYTETGTPFNFALTWISPTQMTGVVSLDGNFYATGYMYYKDTQGNNSNLLTYSWAGGSTVITQP
jgi:hypothetical protein